MKEVMIGGIKVQNQDAAGEKNVPGEETAHRQRQVERPLLTVDQRRRYTRRISSERL